MHTHYDPESPWLGLGMSSLVLAFVAMLVFFLPILGIPVSVFALAFGIIGFFLALYSPSSSLRWSLGGIAASLLALGLNLMIYYAPEGYLPNRVGATPSWMGVPDRPYIAPPARQ
jgi:Na+/H+ antiporter NhaD/arsenite permease-like protein